MITWHAWDCDLNYRVHLVLVFHIIYKCHFKAISTVELHGLEIRMKDMWVIHGSLCFKFGGWDDVFT